MRKGMNTRDYDLIDKGRDTCMCAMWLFIKEDYERRLKHGFDAHALPDGFGRRPIINLQVKTKNCKLIATECKTKIPFPADDPVKNTFPDLKVTARQSLAFADEISFRIFRV